MKRGDKEAGTGTCLMVTGFGKKKPFHDGCGLSSAGRWEPERRTNSCSGWSDSGRGSCSAWQRAWT
eukprot:5905504-Karenia_brevis.AAC.1